MGHTEEDPPQRAKIWEKAARAARKHGAKPLGEGWKDPKRAEANKAEQVQGGKAAPPAPHQHPAYSIWIVNRGRQHVRMCCQHPPKPARFSKSLSPMAACPFCAWQGPPTLARLPSPEDQKGWSPFQGRGTKGLAHVQDAFPSSQGRQPPLLQ